MQRNIAVHPCDVNLKNNKYFETRKLLSDADIFCALCLSEKRKSMLILL
jgi:hypothetical protein